MTKEAAKSSLFYVLDRFGLPTLLLLLGGYWFAGHVADPLVQNHARFLHEQVTISQQNADTLKELTSVVRSMDDARKQQDSILREILAVQRERFGSQKNIVDTAKPGA